MNLVIISGLSGSGKTVALHALEDKGFYCIDNLPVGLLDAFADEIGNGHMAAVNNAAAGIDARNHPDQLNRFNEIIRRLKNKDISCKILFLQADDATLLNRFSETRRKHPLSNSETPLADAIQQERSLLAPISEIADLVIDTSRTNVHELRELIGECLGKTDLPGFSLMLRSFGFKHGIPADADFVFDARCLPNPHWQTNLRHLTGLDKEVADYLESQADVQELYTELERFLKAWIPRFRADNRSYLSIAIGCTGGQHRSVYLVDRLTGSLADLSGDVITRHRDLR